MERPENNITMANLPDSMIHLGGSQFLVVRSYQGHTRVHIRKFVENEAKQLHPTKDGVSLTPRVWVALTEKLPKIVSKRYFERYPDNHVEVVERDLCIFKNITTDGPIERNEVTMQRMFQRRDRSFQLVPETVQLDDPQCYVLLSSIQRVKDLIEASLLTLTLRHHVEKLVKQLASPEALAYTPVPFYEVHPDKTEYSLCECLCELLLLKMKEMAPCYGCEEIPCTCHSLEELVNTYSEIAFYEINYAELAQKFVDNNILHFYFANLILCRDFFTMINVPSFLHDVKDILLPLPDCDALEIC